MTIFANGTAKKKKTPPHFEKECNTFVNYQYTAQHVSRLPMDPPCKCWNSVPSSVNHNWSTIVYYIRYSKKKKKPKCNQKNTDLEPLLLYPLGSLCPQSKVKYCQKIRNENISKVTTLMQSFLTSGM